jgi:hypothetical protein
MSPLSSTDRNPSRSGAAIDDAPGATGGEGDDDTSKDQDPTWSLNAENSGDPQLREPTLAPESGGKSAELKRGPRRIAGDLDLEEL